ncbi:MAG: NTP transferase domain-containing protein [Actinomycetota bacterium]|nr:NTP transferase domain-containing protein [Actinomycetota bacterium]
MEVSGIILCGGQSRRFGPNKLKLKIGRLPLIINQIFKLSFFCTRIILSTSTENKAVLTGYLNKIDRYLKQFALYMHKLRGEEFLLPPVDLVEDNPMFTSRGHSGPMIGLYSGLQKAGCKYSLVAAADMPFIGYKLLEMMKSEAVEGKRMHI